MYRGLTSNVIDISDRYEDGVLTTWGCFQRHNAPSREYELQDSFKHTPLFDSIEDTYTTFKRINKFYAKKQIFNT